MPTTVTTIQWTTVPPTVFDLHYWLWNLIVMLAVTAIILGFAMSRANVNIGSTTFNYLLLIGLFVGSLIDLLFNTADWVLSALILLMLGVYIWRARV